MKDIIQIRNSSQELFTEVMNTIPIHPVSSKIKMLAHGISIPKSPRELEQYISQCDKNDIIPFSRIIFEGNVPLAEFSIPTTDDFKDYYVSLEKLVISHAFQGGKFHVIDSCSTTCPAYLSSNHREDCTRVFTRFKELAFDNLKRQGYEVQHGRLVLAENGGILFFNRGDGCWSKGLELGYYQRMYKEDKTKVESWFDGLKKKYDIDS